MSPVETQLHALEGFTVPHHLHEFAQLGMSVLDGAHNESLEVEHAVLTKSTDHQAYRSFIERTRIDHPLSEERLAVHLGKNFLAIAMKHRHVYEESSYPQGFAAPQSSVVFQNGGVRFFGSAIRGNTEQDITENKEAGQELTSRLHHALGTLGVHCAAIELPLRKAS